jgi:octaprenyl-diphosphate synthase
LLLDEAEYLEIIRGKTAVLFGWACAVGAVAAGRPTEEVIALRTFGDRLGTAFQIVDDLLDVSGDPHLTGKALFADLREGKTTYPLIAAAKLDPELAIRLGRLSHSTLVDANVQAELAAMVTRPECLAATRRRAQDFAEGALAQLDATLPGPAGSLLHALVLASISRDL